MRPLYHRVRQPPRGAPSDLGDVLRQPQPAPRLPPLDRQPDQRRRRHHRARYAQPHPLRPAADPDCGGQRLGRLRAERRRSASSRPSADTPQECQSAFYQADRALRLRPGRAGTPSAGRSAAGRRRPGRRTRCRVRRRARRARAAPMPPMPKAKPKNRPAIMPTRPGISSCA